MQMAYHHTTLSYTNAVAIQICNLGGGGGMWIRSFITIFFNIEYYAEYIVRCGHSQSQCATGGASALFTCIRSSSCCCLTSHTFSLMKKQQIWFRFNIEKQQGEWTFVCSGQTYPDIFYRACNKQRATFRRKCSTMNLSDAKLRSSGLENDLIMKGRQSSTARR